jgi:hypothetical protein
MMSEIHRVYDIFYYDMHNSAIRTYVSKYIVSSFTNWGVQRGHPHQLRGKLPVEVQAERQQAE